MDLAFIHEAQNSPEIAEILRVLREDTDQERDSFARQIAFADLSLLWVAVADAVGPAPQNSSHLELLSIAKLGSASCLTASSRPGAQEVSACADHLAKFINAKVAP